MQTRTPGILSLICLLSTLIFLVLFIADMASAGPLLTFDQVLVHTARQTSLSFWAYANVTLLTVAVTMFMAALYVYCKPASPLWSVIGLVFVPVYCLLNLFAYFSQISIVPRLLELRLMPEYQGMAEFLLRQMVQSWQASAVSIFNNTAYAILGIPSIIFGAALYRMHRSLRLGGMLLALNGAACILGVIGVVMHSPVLSWGSLVGAVFFLLALFPLTRVFLIDNLAGQI
jgi:hypothetical protein